jgi:hypothetical protein
MDTFFQLFDLASGNVMADYAREEDAWAELSQLAAEEGPEVLRDLGLLRFDHGQPSLVAMDNELIARVLAAGTALDPVEISSS